MTILEDDARKVFEAATERHRANEKAYRDSERDARRIAPKVVGKQVLVADKRYEITDIHASYDGTIHARGYKIVANGKRGSQKWDIGFICARHFDDAAG